MSFTFKGVLQANLGVTFSNLRITQVNGRGAMVISGMQIETATRKNKSSIKETNRIAEYCSEKSRRHKVRYSAE